MQLCAQQVFKGTVYDNLSLSPEKGVIVSVYEGESVVFFTKTASNGSYALSVQNPKNKTVFFRKVGFEDFQIAFGELQEKIYLARTSEAREFLDEVTVTAEKNYMRTKGDTITYGADHLRTAGATTVEDLIQNIPGISVDKLTGAIRYRNKEISNILVDGDNITDKNYQLVSKTLGQESAKAIQVIEGYSGNELLKNFKRTNDIALNLQIDEKYRNKIKGSARAGYGLVDRYDENANLIFISKKAKAINIASYNNIGNFSLGNVVSSKNLEINSQPLLNKNELEWINLTGNYDRQLRLSLFNTTNVLENNDFTLSTNQTYSFGDNAKMRSNITYYKDNITSSLFESIDPYDINNNTILSHLYTTNPRVNLDAKIEFSKIRDDMEEIFLRAQFKNRQRHNSELGVQNNEPLLMMGQIANPEVRFMVDYTRKIKPRAAVVFFNNSTISTLTEADRILSSYNLHFLDSLPVKTAVQNLDRKVFKNNFGVNYAYKITNNNVLTAGLLFANYDLYANSLLSTDNAALQNSLKNHKITNFSPQFQWSFFSKEHNLSFLAKTNWIGNKWEGQSKNHFEITPEVNYQFKRITQRLCDIKVNIQAQRSLDFYDFYEYSDIPMFQSSNYLYLNNNPEHIYYIRNKIELSTSYGFTRSGVELNSNFTYDTGKRPLIDNLSFFENYYYNEVLEKENDLENFIARLEFKKYLTRLGTNITLTPSYTNIRSESMSEGESSRNNLRNYQLRLNIGAALSNSIHVSLGSLYNYAKNTHKGIFENSQDTYVQNFSGYLNGRVTLSDDKFIFNIQNEYVNFEALQGFFYSSILSRFKTENSRFEFGLDFKNVFNSSSFSFRRATKDFLYEKKTTVIPRLLVFSAKYVF